VAIAPAVLEEARAAEHERAGAGYVSAVARSPFVVVATSRVDSDEAVATIEWAGARLRRQLFDAEPAKPVAVWVFGTEDEYRGGSSAALGIVADTPYGFYSPCKRALVVDAAYGWGTLIHEMVHAYIAADFPDAPVWMAEGLASLFENAVERPDGSIAGTPNWRLPALKSALERGRAPSFHSLGKAGRGAFHGEDGHIYYATARYLCFWLQEHGLLERFYVSTGDARPTGSTSYRKSRGWRRQRSASNARVSSSRCSTRDRVRLRPHDHACLLGTSWKRAVPVDELWRRTSPPYVGRRRPDGNGRRDAAPRLPRPPLFLSRETPRELDVARSVLRDGAHNP
jgi:hypothetical protein